MRAEQYFEALRTCPVTTIRELTGGRPFVVLSPHPDDETLGTGGLIAEACTRGQEVDVIVVTDGSGSHPRSKQYPRQRLVDLRYSEVHKAGLALGLRAGSYRVLGTAGYHGAKIGPTVRCGGRGDAKRNPALGSRSSIRDVGERPSLRSRGSRRN